MAPAAATAAHPSFHSAWTARLDAEQLKMESPLGSVTHYCINQQRSHFIFKIKNMLSLACSNDNCFALNGKRNKFA
jgi:hypothetical protein